MKEKPKILLVCVRNSARSQMAEALLRDMAGDRFEIESAGLKPGALNPLAIKAMKEIGLDISRNKTKSVFDFYKAGRLYKYVITVCDELSAERCPIFPGVTKRLHWPFADPSTFEGTEGEKLEKTRQVRERIKAKIEAFLADIPE